MPSRTIGSSQSAWIYSPLGYLLGYPFKALGILILRLKKWEIALISKTSP